MSAKSKQPNSQSGDEGRKEEGQESSLISKRQNIVPQNISEEMRKSYLDYAMSVITSRALPDVRDGLKPVHRRILYSMHELGLHAGAKTRKSAKITGDVTGNYHPHGDVAVYESLVKLTQPFSIRYPMAIGQGNFGCFTKDTKVRLADGRTVSFDQLIDEERLGKKNYTFTVNAQNKIEIALISNPRLTIKDAQLVEVTLDTDEKIKCTPNHRFMNLDGSYTEAKDLKSGVSLMPLYTRLSKKGDSPLADMEGYEMVFQPHEKTWTYTHHLADAYNITNGVYTEKKGKVRHHIDFIKLNNSPENILRMQWLEHWNLHSHLTAEKHAHDPSYVQKLREGREAFWAKEENRKAMSERMSAQNIKNWKNGQYRQKMSRILSEVNIAYNLEHPENKLKYSKLATKTLKKLWQNPAYRLLMHEKIIKGNKNHTTNKTGKVKFDKICLSLIKKQQALTSENYEAERTTLYSYKGATTWNTGISKYYNGNVDFIRAQLAGNHKVKSVIHLKEREDVYDLTVNGTHNFALATGVFVHNSVDGDSAAAPRYTEAKMSRIAAEMVKDIEKDTVDWRPNYENTRKEPSVMPAAVPNLIINGTLGIAVGMATNIPPHNLREVIDAITYMIDNKDAAAEDLLQFIKGPDFPTGGVIYGEKDIHHAYATGRGGVVCRGEAEIVETKSGQSQIIITSIPYRVNKADLIMSIADQVREKKVEGIKGIRDESTQDIRIVIDLKQGSYPQNILNYLYKHTQLEDVFHFNTVALVDGVPQTLSLKSFLEEFIKHRQVVVRRRTEFDLRQAEDREHILLGLKKALDHIDEIIALIKKSEDTAQAHANLMKKFAFSDRQATAILEMKLQRLAGLERKKIEDELKAVQALIKELKDLLSSPRKILNVIKEELAKIKEKYGDDRRTRVIKSGVKDFKPEDIIPDVESVLVLTAGGYIKRTDPEEYRKQKRGGVGVVDLDTKEEDFVTHIITASNHCDILFFTDKGKAFQIKMYEIPEGRRATRGKSIMNFLALGEDEKVTSILPMSKESKRSGTSLLMVTKQGVSKKVNAESFHDVRRSGLIAIRLEAGDQLISVSLVEKGDDVIIATAEGQSIRFKESDVREMGRAAAGVIGVRLQKNDYVIGADAIAKSKAAAESTLLVVTENGYGKRTKISEYKVQNRGGSGIKTAKVTAKTGKVMASRLVVGGETDELVAISKKSQVIRVEVKEIPILGRQTQGVRVMKLRAGDSLASAVCI